MAGTAELAILLKARDQFSRTFRQAGGELGGLQRAATKFGPIAGAALAGVGIAAIKFSTDFNAATNIIRTGTGATGDALKGLEADFRATFKAIPASMQDAAQATADLNTRLGLTGPPLQQLSQQYLNLARITKTEVASTIAEGTRVLGDWGIATEDAARANDVLFTVVQTTGIELSSLQRQIVQYGAPLRQMGFSFEEAAALIGKFEKEGVNSELVMGSLRIALGKMARDGEPAVETFQRMVEEIKNAGDASKANALALELFGARAGPDMAAAIREGRFEIDSIVRSLQGAEGNINQVAADTLTLSQRFTILRNRALVRLEPVLKRVFGALEAGAKFLAEHQDLAAALAVAVGTVLVAAFTAWTVSIIAANAALLANPITLVVLALAALAAGVVLVIKHWDEIKAKTIEIWNSIKGFLADNWQTIVNIALAVLFPPAGGIFFIVTHFEEVKSRVLSIVATLRDSLLGAFRAIPGLLLQLGTEFFTAARSLGQALWDGLVSVFQAGGVLAQDIGRTVVNAIISLVNSQVIDRINSALDFRIPGPGPLPDIRINPPDIPPIPALAHGGIVTRPTLAMLGEGGRREAVIPLEGGGFPVVINLTYAPTFSTASPDEAQRMAEFLAPALRRQRRLLGGADV